MYIVSLHFLLNTFSLASLCRCIYALTSAHMSLSFSVSHASPMRPYPPTFFCGHVCTLGTAKQQHSIHVPPSHDSGVAVAGPVRGGHRHRHRHRPRTARPRHGAVRPGPLRHPPHPMSLSDPFRSSALSGLRKFKVRFSRWRAPGRSGQGLGFPLFFEPKLASTGWAWGLMQMTGANVRCGQECGLSGFDSLHGVVAKKGESGDPHKRFMLLESPVDLLVGPPGIHKCEAVTCQWKLER